MNKAFWKMGVLFFIIMGISPGFSQQGSVSLESKVDRTKITIGDRITYSIIVTKDENVEIEMPEVGAKLDSFEVLDYNDPEPKKVDGKIIQTREYIISTFDVGEYEIPAVTIRFSIKDDTTWKELTTEKIKIEVESLKPSEAGDIRDIKPPLEIKRNIKGIIRLIAAGVILIAIGVLTYFLIKRIKEGKGLLPKRQKPARPAHAVALEELDKLIGSNLLAQGEIKQFYIQLTEIIRKYIEGRYYIIALEMTTLQLIQNMKQAKIDKDIIILTSDFLDNCDLVKFAKYIPEEEENQIAIQQAYDIVHKTKIVLQDTEGEVITSEKATPELGSEEQPEIAASAVSNVESVEKEIE